MNRFGTFALVAVISSAAAGCEGKKLGKDEAAKLLAEHPDALAEGPACVVAIPSLTLFGATGSASCDERLRNVGVTKPFDFATCKGQQPANLGRPPRFDDCELRLPCTTAGAMSVESVTTEDRRATIRFTREWTVDAKYEGDWPDRCTLKKPKVSAQLETATATRADDGSWTLVEDEGRRLRRAIRGGKPN